MATHECSACLQETIQGASEVVGFLVLPISSCPASGGVHTWMRKTSTAGYYYFNSLHVLIYSTSYLVEVYFNTGTYNCYSFYCHFAHIYNIYIYYYYYY